MRSRKEMLKFEQRYLEYKLDLARMKMKQLSGIDVPREKELLQRHIQKLQNRLLQVENELKEVSE